MLPPLVNTGFQVLFHSPPGVLFTFPSRYYTLSVTKSCLALEGGPPCFPQGSSCPVVLWIPAMQCSVRVPDCHRLWSSFPTVFHSTLPQLCRSATPQSRSSAVWAFPRSLAATKGISVDFFSSGYLDVSLHRVPSVHLWIQCTVIRLSPYWVSPFGNPWIKAHLQLPMAYRSLSRPSSALGAKASSLCFLSLDLLDQILKTNQVPFFLLNRPLSLPVRVLCFRFERFEIVGSQFLCLALFKASLFPFAFSVSFVLCSCQGPQERSVPEGTVILQNRTVKIQNAYSHSYCCALRLSRSRRKTEPSVKTHLLVCSCRKRFFRTLRRVSLERR